MDGKIDSTGMVTAFFAAWRQLDHGARVALVAAAELMTGGPGGTGRLLSIWAKLGADERRVVLALAERMVAGREVYGDLNLTRDKRDFLREAGQELLDAVAYLAMDALRRAEPRENRDVPAAETQKPRSGEPRSQFSGQAPKEEP